MKTVSDAYKQAISGNVIPKCEPRITVTYVGTEGEDATVVWNAKDIKDFNYKQGYDPLGRTLPFIEATWTELYYGDLDENGEPERYSNITEHSLVTIEFVQDLTVGLNQWKTLHDNGTKWSDLLSTTWKNVLRSKQQEIIEMPKLFLSAKPEIKDKTITWKANDLLSFLTSPQDKTFNAHGYPFNINQPLLPYVVSNLLLDERAAFENSRYILQAIKDTVHYWCGTHIEPVIRITEPILLNGTTNNCILNLCTSHDSYIWFDENRLRMSRTKWAPTTKIPFNKRTLKKYPVLTKNPNVSSYQYKKYELKVEPENAYNIDYKTVDYNDGKLAYWIFNGLGTLDYESETNGQLRNYNHRYAVAPLYEYTELNPQTRVYPLSYDGYNKIINFSQIGEAFVEDNPTNVYDVDDFRVEFRASKLELYFGHNNYSLEFEAFPNLAFETNDVVGVETNLKKDNENIVKYAIIVEFELSYNGVLTEKIKAHEVF